MKMPLLQNSAGDETPLYISQHWGGSGGQERAGYCFIAPCVLAEDIEHNHRVAVRVVAWKQGDLRHDPIQPWNIKRSLISIILSA